MNERRVLITGAGGMLGGKVLSLFLGAPGFAVTGWGSPRTPAGGRSASNVYADLLDTKRIPSIVKKMAPDLIIHCAANVDLNDCEQHPERADLLHADATRALAAAAGTSTRFVYISTDSVYEGTRGDYGEDAAAAPQNHYALSKLKGEEAVRQELNNYVILRTNIYGFRQNGGSSLFEWAAANLKAGREITGFDDVYFNPLYTGQLAMVIRQLIENDYTGTVNAGCREQVSKYEFLLQAARMFGWDTALILRGNSDMFPSTLKRPKNTTLNLNQLKRILGKVPTLEEGLRQLSDDFK